MIRPINTLIIVITVTTMVILTTLNRASGGEYAEYNVKRVGERTLKENATDLSIGGFDFSGDYVPLGAVELLIEAKKNRLGVQIRDDYWIPVYRLNGNPYGYIILCYSGPGDAPSIDTFIEKCNATDFSKPGPNYLNDFSVFLANTDYTDCTIAGLGGFPLLISRANADKIARKSFGHDFESVTYIYDGRFAEPGWGYKYSDGTEDIYILSTDAYAENFSYYTADFIADFEARKVNADDLLPSLFPNWRPDFRTEDERELYKNKERTVWVDSVKEVLRSDDETEKNRVEK